MNESDATSDWAAARGEKWGAQLGAMESMLASVDEPLLAALALERPCRIAEVGAGGGATALAILARAPEGTIVHGFDLSSALVARARERVPAGAQNLAFEVADMATAAPAQPYDRLVSRFGVMFFADPPAAFANLMRWLAPRGRFAFAVWGPLADNRWMASVREVVARIVDVPRLEPDAPGAFRYGDANALLALLDRAGARELDGHEWRGTLPIGGGLAPAAAAEFALSAFASFGDQLAAAGDAALDEARRSLTACFAEHWGDDGVRMDACVHIVTGARR